jgi:hypothetical protein
MVMTYKGREFPLPLSDEDREWLQARSKDTMISALDREYANIKHHEEMIASKEAEADESERELSDEDAEEDDDDPDYDNWTVAELTSEIEERNQEEGRETPIPTQGKKAELVARIREDDAREVAAE